VVPVAPVALHYDFVGGKSADVCLTVSYVDQQDEHFQTMVNRGSLTAFYLFCASAFSSVPQICVQGGSFLGTMSWFVANAQ
jgi:hypothetical protein